MSQRMNCVWIKFYKSRLGIGKWLFLKCSRSHKFLILANTELNIVDFIQDDQTKTHPFDQCFSRAFVRSSFIDLSIVLGSSTRPADT